MSEQHSSETAPTAPRRGPVETLDRPTLLRRYRLARNFAALFGVLAVVLGGVAIGQQLALGGSPGAASASASDGTATETSDTDQECAIEARNDPDDPMAIGDPGAPVVIAEWTDFRCPYCGVFSRDTLPTLLKEYVDTGKVRIEVHDVNFIDGDVSTQTAVAVRAAGEQGKYFDYLTAIYAGMADDRPEITEELLVTYAREAGVPDIEQFTADLSSAELAAAVEESATTASSYGVSSVPTFVNLSNCQAVQGAQPIEQFRTFFDNALEEAGA